MAKVRRRDAVDDYEGIADGEGLDGGGAAGDDGGAGVVESGAGVGDEVDYRGKVLFAVEVAIAVLLFAGD